MIFRCETCKCEYTRPQSGHEGDTVLPSCILLQPSVSSSLPPPSPTSSSGGEGETESPPPTPTLAAFRSASCCLYDGGSTCASPRSASPCHAEGSPPIQPARPGRDLGK